jgi:hypothetical protein
MVSVTNISIADATSSSNRAVLVERIALTASAVATVAALGWLLWYCRYGIDFTDEGLALVWMSNPWIYSTSVTQFGYIYHPLYQLVGGDIALLRQSNIVITFGLGLLLCATFLNAALKSSHASVVWQEPFFWVVAAGLATSSLLFLGWWWLPTPSYNSLALQALLLGGIGLLLAEKAVSLVSIIGWVVIGVAGWLAFMAKPTTAAALATVSAAYLLWSGKLNIRLLAISVMLAVALLLASAWMIDGSILVFFRRLREGVDAAQALSAGYTPMQLLRFDDFYLRVDERYVMIVTVVLVAIAVCLCTSSKQSLRTIGMGLPVLIATAAWPSIVAGRGLWLVGVPFQGLSIWAAPLGAVIAAIVLNSTGLFRVMRRGHWALALCFAIFPHVYAFGTGNNYWQMGASAGLFWVLAGLVPLVTGSPATASRRVFFPVTISVQVVTISLLYAAMETPYRQPQALRKQDQTVSIGINASQIILSKDFADYFNTTRKLADESGFQPGTPVIDMSGQSPTALYSLGAKSIGQAWTIGGYKGSDDLAFRMLSKVSCEEMARAWLLIEPDGPGKLSSGLLESFGMDVAKDFSIMGMLNTPVGAGGEQMQRQQQLLKPSRPNQEAKAACEKQRDRGP